MLRRHGLSRLADTDRPACPCATAASDPASWPTWTSRSSGASHPGRAPQTNGKVERDNRTLLAEWASARLYRSNRNRRRALGRFLDFYNHRRPHTALGRSRHGGPRQQP
jgi:transposase InsO family protein